MIWASYTRAVSTRKSDDNPADAISIQNKHINAYMKKHGWKVSKKYSDRKFSPDAKDAFDAMVHDGMCRMFDGVVVDSMYRCGRSPYAAIEILQDTFYEVGIQFAVAEDDFNSVERTAEEVADYFYRKRGDFIRQRMLTHAPDSPKRQVKSRDVFSGMVYDAATGEKMKYANSFTVPDMRVISARRDFCLSVPDVEGVNAIPGDTLMEKVILELKKMQDLAVSVNKRLLNGEGRTLEDEALTPLREKAQALFTELDKADTRRTRSWEAYRAGELSEEEYQKEMDETDRLIAEYDPQFQALTDEAAPIQRAFSVKNPWLRKYRDIDIPKELDRRKARRWIERVMLEDFKNVSIVPKEKEWMNVFPPEWLAGNEEG